MNPMIELLRGIGAWMVLNTHYLGGLCEKPCGIGFLWTGVYLFFVISGFVFAKYVLFVDIRTVPFLIRRLFRIYPLYALAVLSYFYIKRGGPGALSQLVQHLAFLNTTTVEGARYFNPPFWSLPVEMEFYLAIPLLVRFRRRFGIAAIYLLVFVSIAFKLGLAIAGLDVNTRTVLEHHLPHRFAEFGVGIAVYHIYTMRRSWAQSRLGRSIAIFLGVAALIVLERGFEKGPGNVSPLLALYFTLLVAVAYGFLLFGLVDWQISNRYVLKLALTIGALSYAVYLFHNIPRLAVKWWGAPTTEPIGYMLAIILLLGGCAMLYRYVEAPMREHGRSLTHRWASAE